MSLGTEEEDQPIMFRTPSVDDVEMESPEISTSPKSPDMSISPKWHKNRARVRFVSESSDTESLCNSAAASATLTDVSYIFIGIQLLYIQLLFLNAKLYFQILS